jgi:hypothetical protein
MLKYVPSWFRAAELTSGSDPIKVRLNDDIEHRGNHQSGSRQNDYPPMYVAKNSINARHRREI